MLRKPVGHEMVPRAAVRPVSASQNTMELGFQPISAQDIYIDHKGAVFVPLPEQVKAQILRFAQNEKEQQDDVAPAQGT